MQNLSNKETVVIQLQRKKKLYIKTQTKGWKYEAVFNSNEFDEKFQKILLMFVKTLGARFVLALKKLQALK